MTDKALVLSAEDSRILVLPLFKSDSDVDSLLESGHRLPLAAKNPRDLPLRKGSLVRLSSSKKMLALRGFICLLFPFFAAVAAYLACPAILSWLSLPASELCKAICIFLSFALATAFVFALTRIFPFFGIPEISEIV